MLNVLHVIAERKISEALSRGELDVKGWENRPLPSEDNHLVPPDLRMAYKILSNSGYLPPELEDRKEIKRLEELIAETEDEHVRLRQLKKLECLRLKMQIRHPRALNLEEHEEYHRKIVERIPVAPKK